MALLLFFVLVPILEIAAAIFVAGHIGWLSTLAIIAGCSLLGVWQLKVQGIGAWRRVRDEVRNGQVPAATMLDGALRVIGAVLLSIPGLCTAVVSVPLLIGPTRRLVGRSVSAMTIARFKVPFMVVTTVGNVTGVKGRRRAPGVVDVEGWEETPRGSDAAPPALPGPQANDRS